MQKKNKKKNKQKCNKANLAIIYVLHFIFSVFLLKEVLTSCVMEDDKKKIRDAYFDKVKKVVIEQLGVEADKVTEESSFIGDLGADSLDTVELIMAFEEEFNVEIPDEEAEKIKTVADSVNYIMEHKC